MLLKHPVVNYLSDQDINILLDEVVLFNVFCNRLETVADQKYNDDEDALNKFKGDLFELFVEFLIKYKGTDNRIAITDYQTSNEANIVDYGVDGVGVSTTNSRVATVQVKYRQSKCLLTYNEGNFGNFGRQSTRIIKEFGGKDQIPDDNSQMLYITSAGEVHYSVADADPEIRVIKREGLRELTDNVTEFWLRFKESILKSRIKKVKGNFNKIIPRDHQICAVNAILDDMRTDDGKGKIILPTGCGKTIIQADVILKANAEFGYSCFLILSPRILLSYQHLASVANYLISNGCDADYLNVNSGSFDEKLINEERCKHGLTAANIPSTTKSSDIKKAVERAEKTGKILVISSTYHSAERVREAGIKVDIQINDEAHNMVSEEFSVCHGIGSNQFHFTATEKYADGDLGMENEEKWGNTAYERLPKEMIDAGEMIPPILHIVHSEDNEQVKENDFNALFRAIVDSFDAHRMRLHRDSMKPEMISPKMIVTVGGQETLEGIIGKNGNGGCNAFRDFCTNHPEIKVFAISSDLGAYMNGNWAENNNKIKDLFLKELQNLSNTKEAIILYVDMLTEGIDVPGITAFMPLRGMSDAKFKQGVGRATRLFGHDRKRFYAEEIKPSEPIKYVKPYAEVIVPTVMINSLDHANRYKKLWFSTYDTYGHHEHVVLTNMRGIDRESSLVDVNELNRNLKGVNSGVNKFLHDILGRPDQLDIDELVFIQLISECIEVAQSAYERLNLQYPFVTYKSIAKWHKDSGVEFMAKVKEMRNSGQSVFSDEIKKKYGTIYTPDFVVQKTVDTAWKYLPKDKDVLDLTYIDPACGDGNFLEYVYHKLMIEGVSISDPVKRSRYIITKCLWGYEILDKMVKAAKIRLCLLHAKTIKDNNAEADNISTLMDELHIYWGNAICLPEDTEQDWYNGRGPHEGGILDEHIREKKFDVIVGNPPYTRLERSSRNAPRTDMDGRHFCGYYNQRDMAQIFILWGLSHSIGLVCYNIIDTWIGKILDGAKETRSIIDGRLIEVITNEEIKRYSENDGGSINTCITLFNHDNSYSVKYNNSIFKYNKDEFVSGVLKKKIENATITYNFVNISVIKYVNSMTEKRSINTSSYEGKQRRKLYDSNIFYNDHGEQFFIVGSMRQYKISCYKLVMTNDISSFIQNNLSGRMKYCQVHKGHGLWLIGYFSTTMSSNYLSTYTDSKQKDNYELKTFLWQFCRVPDFDYYKKNRPERFQAYMEWIEQNMHNKDVFLAGIDEQFEMLIKD